MTFPVLETERLRLVEVQKTHAERFFEIMSKDEVTQYYGMSSLKRIEEAQKIIETFRTTFESKRGIRWGVEFKTTGELVGTVGLNNLATWSKKAEVGYELHPDYWGQGLTTEAVKEVLRYSFHELDLYRMGAVTFPQNGASIQVLNKLGFKKEGTLRGYLYQNNQSHDASIFSLLKPEWSGQSV
ncbi:MAG TPA: GNAT family protein [Sporolactobacillaceae bacterium]|nr:GNAT family protein [Sporolactobacillaceae bacterium]